MNSLYCHHCGTHHLIGASAIRSIHNTEDGPIAYVTCPVGHTVVVSYG